MKNQNLFKFKEMRIGILTYHYVFNFGANLQVYSTIEYLKNNGFDPIVINWIPEDLELRYKGNIPIVQADAHKKFIKDHIPCSEICRTDLDIAKLVEKSNIKRIIIGSDAVLQHKSFLSRVHLQRKGIIVDPVPGSDVLFPNPFWGSFIPSMKKKIPVSIMAASSMNTNYKYFRGNLKKKMNTSLSQFQSVTVRDDWTMKMVKYITNGKIIPSIMPDPVFAYNQNIKDQASKKDILNKFRLSDNYILLSFRNQRSVSKEWMQAFGLIAEKNNLQCVALTMPGGIKFDAPFPKSVESPLCPTDWYGLIKYSSGYIGENMHPIVVALHNSVPFFSFDSYGIVKYKYFVNEKSSKIYDLLSLSGFLKKRICRLGKGYRSPSPGSVFFQIKDFDFEKCKHFSINQLNKYNSMMESLLSL